MGYRQSYNFALFHTLILSPHTTIYQQPNTTTVYIQFHSLVCNEEILAVMNQKKFMLGTNGNFLALSKGFVDRSDKIVLVEAHFFEKTHQQEEA